jgi:hypothetical protein
MARERAKWETLYSSCKGAIDSSSKGLAKANADGQKNQAETDVLVKNYCDKYSNLKDNPDGACDEAKELTDMFGKIVGKMAEGRISGKAVSISKQFNKACQASNNEQKLLDSIDDSCDDNNKNGKAKNCEAKNAAILKRLNRTAKAETKISPVKKSNLCASSSSDEKDFIAKAITNFSSEDQKKLQDTDKIADLIKKIESEKINDNGVFSDLKDFVDNQVRGDTFCEKISNSLNSSADPDVIKIKEKITKDEAKLEGADDKLITAINANIDRYKKEISEIDKKYAEKELKYAEMRTRLASINMPDDPQSQSASYDKLTSLGQQVDESCDAMNSNALVKSTSGSGVYDNFLKTYGATQQ